MITAQTKSSHLKASRIVKSIAVALLALTIPTKATAQSIPRVPMTGVEMQRIRNQKQFRIEAARSAVVRIVNGCVGKAYLPINGKTYTVGAVGYGSGYFATSNGHIITNAHVVQLSQSQEQCKQSLFKDFAKQVYQDYASVDLNTLKDILQQSKLLSYTPIQKVLLQDGKSLPFEKIVSGAPDAIGKDVAIIKIDVKNASVLKLARSNNVELLDRVTVIGYPAAADSQRLNDESFHVPSITDGAVSAIKKTKDGTPVIQTNASVTHGNSGGPVVNAKGEVIGIVAFRGDTVNDQEVQGFSFIIPSNTIKEFVVLAGIDNKKEEISQR